MNNNLENLLSKVGTPIGRTRFKLLKFLNFNNRQFRIKFLKISGVVTLSLFLIWFFAGSGTEALKIQKSENVKTGNKIVDQISKLIVIPDEMPVIATIIKAELLKDKKFFQGADNGDHVLIFKKANKAILFSQTANKILNIGTLEETEVDFR